MKPIGTHNYFVYITTNKYRKVLYTGMTNDLRVRMYQHRRDALTGKKSFVAKYNATYLIYWDRFEYVQDAIDREKQIKGWRRSKKERLISEFNPGWKFLNGDVEE